MERVKNNLSKIKSFLSPYRASQSKSEEAEEAQIIARVSRTNKDVQDLKTQTVAGVGESSQTALDNYKELFEGIDLEFMKDDVFQKDHNGFSASASDEDSQVGQTQAKEEKSISGEPLSEEDQAEVQKLQARDREVRAHEQAHVAAGGQYVRGGISYEYQQGPDGRRYAVGGHVNIDVSEAGTPEETVQKMRQVRRAALAPAEPSGADRAVASEASKKEQQAQAEINKERVDGQDEDQNKDQSQSTFKARSRHASSAQKSSDHSSVIKTRGQLIDRSASSYTQDPPKKNTIIKPPRG